MLSRFVKVICGVILGALLCFGYTIFNEDVSLPGSEAKRVVVSESTKDVPYWRDQIDFYGGKEAYATFLRTYEDYSYDEQHAFAHTFGEALYKEEGVSGVAVCDGSFAFGCYHSFFGFALMDNGLAILDELDAACIAVHGEKGLGCQHGIGHGVIAELGFDKLEESLEACAALNWKGKIGGCSSGVYMEYNFQTMSEVSSRRALEIGEEHFPCSDLPSQFQPGCYFAQPTWWLSHTDDNYGFVGRECQKISDQENKDACFRGAGHSIAGGFLFDIPEIQAACNAMGEREGEMLCIEGATWITANHPDYNDTWMDFCNPLEGAFYERCVASKDFI